MNSSMRFWLATHYPHYQPDRWPWNVYVKTAHHRAGHLLGKGDKVAFYEHKGRKKIKGFGKPPTGREGVVCLAVVKDAIEPCDLYEEYTDGTVGDYAWQVPCADHQWSGFVDRKKLCEILDYKTKYNFHGYNGGKGFKQLTPEQFARIEMEFHRFRES